MNQIELSQKLAPVNGLLVVSAGTFDNACNAFLNLYYAGGPITISEATLVTEPQADGAIVYTGKSTFTNLPDLPVTARFLADADGNVHMELRYVLRGAAADANPWVFSRSFPGLPTAWNSLLRTRIALLDSLDLYETALVVVNAPGKDRLLDVPLAAGINFVSRLRPTGLLGVFSYASEKNPSAIIYGIILLPKPDDLIVDLLPEEYPWDRIGSTSPPPPPGIYLQMPIALGFTLGKLSMRNTCLRTYTPISIDWMRAHLGFDHEQAYTATLAIPSAQIEVDLSALMELDEFACVLNGQCSGITLRKLDHILDLTGRDGLLNCMPNELQKPIENLEKLELMHVGLDIVLSGGVPKVRGASFTVGFPDLKWHVWSDDLVVESLSCRFVLFDPFTPTTTSATSDSAKPSFPFLATVKGVLSIEGVPVAVTASSDDDFAVMAQTVAPAKLPLDKLVKKHGPGVPVPSALTINYLEVNVWYGKAYSMRALLAGDPDPWTITVGKRKFVMSNVVLSFTKPATGALTGSMSGTLEFLEGVKLQANYNIPGSLMLRCTLPSMKISRIINDVCNRPVKMPSGLDFKLQYGSVLVRQDDKAKTFLLQIVAQVEGLGSLAFETRQAGDGTWGFAYGLELLAGNPSQVGGLGALAALEKQLHLRKFLIVVSSLDQPGFQLPDNAQFNNPYLPTKKVSLPGSGGVSAGLNIFAEWNLDSSNKQQKLLKSLLGLGDTLQVTMQVGENPADNCKLFFGSSGKLQGHPFQYKVGMMLTKGEPSFFLTGSVTINVQKQPVTFDMTTLFVASGAFMSASMRSAKPVDCGPFNLANIGVEVGVNWGGIPSLGLTATLDVKNFESSIAVFFDSTNPAQSLVAGSISKLTLKDVVDTLLGTSIKSPIDDVLHGIGVQGTRAFTIAADLADELDQGTLEPIVAAFQSQGKIQLPSTSAQILLVVNKKSAAWHLTDLSSMRHYALEKSGNGIKVTLEAQFYFAPQATSIGSVPFKQGFFINGALQILGWHAEATVDIQTNRGISVDAQMDAISLGKGGIFSLTAAKGPGGPQLSISTMAQPSHPTEAFRQPHVYINGAIQILGLKEIVLASLTSKSLILDLKGNLAPGVEFDLDVECSSSGFTLAGDIKAGIGTIDLGDLGKIKVNTDIEGTLGVRLNGEELSLAAEASFEFLGNEKSIGKFNLGTDPDELAKLSKTLAKKVEDLLKDEFKDAAKWANAVKNGMVDGVDDAEKVLTKVYGKSEKEAKEAAKDIGKGVNKAEKAVTKTASKFGKKMKKMF